MPEIVERDEQPYVAVRATVRMSEIAAFAERGDEVFGWLAERGIEPAGAVFFKYDVVDMDAGLVMELGVPVAAEQSGEGEIVTGVLPAGQYARVAHHGHPDGLLQATSDLLAWADQEGLEWDADGNNWGCRLEVYHSDPDEVPDLNDWDTELLFRLKDRDVRTAPAETMSDDCSRWAQPARP